MTPNHPSLAMLRRLYHHLAHGGTVSADDQQRSGVVPLTLEHLARRIEVLERKDRLMEYDPLAYLQTVASAMVQDSEAVVDAHYAGKPVAAAAWAALYASISAVKALLPDIAIRPIPPHLVGRVWRVSPFIDPDGQWVAEPAIDDSVVVGDLLVVADSAEAAIASIKP